MKAKPSLEKIADKNPGVKTVQVQEIAQTLKAVRAIGVKRSGYRLSHPFARSAGTAGTVVGGLRRGSADKA